MDTIDIKKFKFFKKIAALPFVDAVILYGSRARSDFKEKSDIDLAIVCPHAAQEDWFKVLDLIDDADTLLHIDCVRFDTLQDKDPLKGEILRDGKYLYTKEN